MQSEGNKEGFQPKNGPEEVDSLSFKNGLE